MTSALLPANEPERLAALMRYEVLDTAAEGAFDELTQLAAYVCGTRSALVTLIDARRQWFKSRWTFEARETTRELAFCAHTILQRDVLVVPDATRDPRFTDNALVTGPPHIRFYAGTPLVTADGHALGSLAVVDYQPRQLDAGQRRALVALGHQVLTQLELRRRLVAEQRQSEERYRELVEDVREVIITLAVDGTITAVNRAAEGTLGSPRAAWIGRPFAAMVYKPDRDLAVGLLERVRRGEKPPSFELRLTTTTGAPVSLEFTVTPRFAGDRVVGILGVGRDVSERKRLEEQLRQSQKLEALGQLSGGVAHDFNNLLTVIQCNAMLVRSAAVAEVKTHADEIMHAAERAASLTRQLLMVSRKQVMQPTIVDLNEVAQNLLRMLVRIVGEDIVVRSELAPALSPLQGDVGMLEQVLLNLVVNARDAMPRGGTLTIATRAARADEPRPEGATGPCVCLSVRDTGAGIPPEVMPHVFEPFFTTKPVGKGTGLGLATVYGIVKQHGGWIEIASEPGTGTTFDVWFPVAEAVHAAAPPRDAVMPRSLAGHETILVVEDEDAIRLLVVNLLRRHGYTVLHAATGAAALEVWRRERERIDLLLTDLVMPGGTSGHELAARLRQDRPGLRVIFTSGYSAELAGHVGLVEGRDFLQKPYQPSKLARTVRDQLDGDGATG